MKLLITGATGLIGRKLTEKFLNEDFDINYLTTVKSKINTIEGAKCFYWNPSQDQIDSTCFSGVDTIIHLAGSTVSKRWSKSYKKKIYSSSGFYGAWVEYGSEVKFGGRGYGKKNNPFLRPAFDETKIEMMSNALKDAETVVAKQIKRHEKRLQKYGKFGY